MAIVKRPRRPGFLRESAVQGSVSGYARTLKRPIYIRNTAREHFCCASRLDYSRAHFDDPGYCSFDTLTKVVHATGQSRIAPAVFRPGAAYTRTRADCLLNNQTASINKITIKRAARLPLAATRLATLGEKRARYSLTKRASKSVADRISIKGVLCQ